MTHYVFWLKEWQAEESILCAMAKKLPQEEREKVHKKNSRGRRQSLLGRWLLRYGISQAVGQQLPVAYTPQGKPVVELPAGEPPVFVSCTHCDGLIGAAVSFVEIGIDAEPLGRFSPKAARRCFSKAEQQIILEEENPQAAFAAFWTLRESCGKMTGQGVLGLPPIEFYFTPPFCSKEDYFCRTWQLEERWAVSLCAQKQGEVRRIQVSKEQLLFWMGLK